MAAHQRPCEETANDKGSCIDMESHNVRRISRVGARCGPNLDRTYAEG
jgi:hypothetical protein